ncbi:sensor histidine kinase [Cellulosimicrobium arenosum]|uniref:histidine kinase n=1 Tax=Cellulosimicrobium arenosum TaxID=2708133 RepID=A0A927PGU1_9MICO|nr:sensor domain-containing protein [Cellulosimicrobium arenosum]MBD8080731.1 sensor domain-containing protein [Cellulosimicrobium arenosum]
MTAVTSDQQDAVPRPDDTPSGTAPDSPAPGVPGATGPAGTRRDPRVVDRHEPVAFLRAPFAGRTWRGYGFLWLALLLAPFAFAYTVFTVSFTAGIWVTVVGLVVSSALVLGGRGWGSMYRSMVRSMLGADVAAPSPYVRPRGFWRTLWGGLGDATGWRTLLFLFVTFPLAITGFVVSTAFLAVGLGATTHWFWSQFLPLQQTSDGSWHRGASFGTDWFVDTPVRQLGLVLVGMVFLWVWPHVTRAVTYLFRVLTVALLAPTLASLRVADLEESRGRTVEDGDAKLRRIERDLHDGTQARLVAVAMQLGEAKEQLASGSEPTDALALVDQAHASTKEALVELRELARGIHPPALDNGLAVALETLAARTPLPVTVDVDPAVEASGRLAPAVESIAYFCVAELVTNAVKHARASGVYVLVERQGTAPGGRGGRRDRARLRLRVRDDGQGGARVVQPGADGHRSGLAGLAERVRSVDGTFELSSPVGGPTVVTVLLPTDV